MAVALPVRHPFTYAIPEALAGRVRVGHAVWVPFGRRRVAGYVVELLDAPDCDPERIRPIRRLLDPEPAFDPGQLALFRWMERYYLAPLGEVIATALPAGLRQRSRRVYRVTPAGIEALAAGEVEGAQADALREVVARPGSTRGGVARRLRDLHALETTERALEALLRRGWVEAEQTDAREAGDRVTWVRRVGTPAGRLGPRQRDVLAALAEGERRLDGLAADLGASVRPVVRRLAARGFVELEERPNLDPVAAGELPAEPAPPRLTEAQAAAVEAICGPPRTWLLHGVTGSGKTEVYLQAARRVLDGGGQVLVLVPEIGLTPLLTGRFRARFGEAVAVLHSGLAPRDRLRAWRGIRAGRARVVVGARSALFAPLARPGLIVVDEEHDDSYKQDEGVRYSARDLAVVMGRRLDIPVVLGSATPSLESWTNARAGRYGLLELCERPTPRPVPTVEVVDLTRQPREADGRVPVLTEPVRAALAEALAQGGQCIVLHNRRGWATWVHCPDCGGEFHCPSCEVALVYHRAQGRLICHLCGFRREYASTCPACGGRLEVLGRGTERIQDVLAEAFPGVPVGRMDADTTAGRGAHHRILEDFRAGRTRILVGTQMVAKGHDFRDVLVVAVLGADQVLTLPDFRAAERARALLVQVAGRAGRGERPGRVLLQTAHPHHRALRSLDDPLAFYEEEARIRRLLAWPPFSRLVLLRLEAADRTTVREAAAALARRLRAALPRGDRSIQVLGPAPAARARMLGRWREQVVLRGLRTAAFRRWVEAQPLEPPVRGVRLIVDVDPRSLL